MAVQYIVQHCFDKNINHIYNSVCTKMPVDQLIAEDHATWKQSMSNDIACKAQGIWDVKGNAILVFISRSEVLDHKKVTYGNMICDY